MTAVAVRPEQAVLLQDVSTTMVYAHLLNSGGCGDRRPLDRP